MNSEKYDPINETQPLMSGEQDGGSRPDATVISVVVMLSIFSVVGAVGNAVVFYIFFRRRNSSTSVIFILALAGTDFLTCLITIPYTIVHELLHHHLVYDLACKSYMFLVTSTVPFSAYIMVGIALDRYFCICHPFLYIVTIPRAKAIILCMTVPALTFGVMTALMHGTYAFREKHIANITSWLNNVSDDQQIHHKMLTDFYRVNPPIPGSTLDSIYTIPGNSLDALNPGSSTNYTVLRFVEHVRVCVQNDFIFSDYFVSIYTKVHGAGFVVAYLIVAILYIFIYKTIYTRRANKAKRKKKNLYPLLAVGGKSEDTQLSVSNGAQTTSLGGPNNQHRASRDPVCPRKIVLTARNDAGIPDLKSTTPAVKSLKVNQTKNVEAPSITVRNESMLS